MYRTNKVGYNKRYINDMFKHAHFKTCVVSLKKFTAEDIENYKLSLIQNKNNTLNEDGNTSKYENRFKGDKTSKSNKSSKNDKKSKNVKPSKGNKTSIDDEPAKKKQKLNTNGRDVLKLVLSRESETHTFKSQFKSSLIPESKVKQEPIASTSTEYSTVPITMFGTIPKTVRRRVPRTEPRSVSSIVLRSASRNVPKTVNSYVLNTVPRTVSCTVTSNVLSSVPSTVPRTVSNTIASNVLSTVPRTVSCTVTSNVFSSVPSIVPRTVSCTVTSSALSSVPSTVPSTVRIPVTRAVPIIETDCEDSTKSTAPANSSAKKVKPLIWVADYRKMMTEENYKNWLKIYNTEKIFNEITDGSNNSAVGEPSTSEPNSNEIKCSLNDNDNKKGQLIKFENLYQMYFTKSVQDSIVIIANILNIISISNKYHKLRINESFKKRTEAEKLKLRCDANRLHGRHNKVLRTKLKGHFTDVVSVFTEIDFDSIFQLFFLSILTILRVLDQPKFKRGSVFKNLVFLLWNTLKDSQYQNERVYSLFRTKHFRSDCIDLISLIEDIRDVDPGITDRMSLFFISTLSSLEYFQPVIHAVTGDSKEDLDLLIDHATFQTRINSQLKDSVASSYDPQLNIKQETIQSPENSDETNQQWLLTKNPDGTYQQIPVIDKSKTIGNTVAESSTATIQQMNNFCQSFSSSLPMKIHEPSTSKTIPTNKCFFVTPNISHGPLVQVTRPLTALTETATSTSTTTYVTFNPSVQNLKPMANIPLIKAEGGTFVVDNKQIYQLVMAPPIQTRTIANGTKNKSIISPKTNDNKCFVKNCKVNATLMCSGCSSVKYCSEKCQQADWYDSHINDCDQRSINKK